MMGRVGARRAPQSPRPTDASGLGPEAKAIGHLARPFREVLAPKAAPNASGERPVGELIDAVLISASERWCDAG